ncbi:ubiquitin carboxyl-terminal hydrolase, family 1 [Xylariaceae sp. FL0662B]|nr:ubiquitin carboxyl-terminal hydrolase, family 1 [Xylariaceae sp. FL0662B]
MMTRKHFIPLESNPELFSELIHRLGVSTSLAFHDVLSLEEADLLALVPRPALALILVIPARGNYTERLAEEEKDVVPHTKHGDGEDVMWYKQTIGNACGLYAILHAVSNGDARNFIEAESHLSRLTEKCKPLGPQDRITVLEDDEELAAAHKAVAVRGDSAAPENPEIEVEYAYMCFVKSHKNGHLYQLEGCRKGPIDLGQLEPGEDILSEKALAAVRGFMKQAASDIGFSMLALAATG